MAENTNPDTPRVVIDWDERGNRRVFADPGVVVYDRHAHLKDDALYRFTPPPIPDGWTDGPAGYLGDGSVEDQIAMMIGEAYAALDDASSR